MKTELTPAQARFVFAAIVLAAAIMTTDEIKTINVEAVLLLGDELGNPMQLQPLMDELSAIGALPS